MHRNQTTAARAEFDSNSRESADGETVLMQFDRLMDDFIAGKMQRTKFRTWEIGILLDILGCDLGRFTKVFVLRQYQHAVRQQLENGADVPMRLSDFLASRAAASA